MCPSSPRASQMPALAELIVCTALATRSSLHSSCVWQAASCSSSDDEISMVFARTSARSSQHDMEAPREDRENSRRSSERPRSSRDPFACCPACARGSKQGVIGRRDHHTVTGDRAADSQVSAALSPTGIPSVYRRSCDRCVGTF